MKTIRVIRVIRGQEKSDVKASFGLKVSKFVSGANDKRPFRYKNSTIGLKEKTIPKKKNHLVPA